MDTFIKCGTVQARNVVRLTTDLALASNGIRLLGYIFVPKGNALFHVLCSDGTSFKVRLQRNTTGKSYLIGISQPVVSIGTKRGLANPTTTIGKAT